MPPWLSLLSWVAVLLGVVCASIVAIDVVRHPQQMRVMNVVWPITGLWAGPLGAWAYYRFGRPGSREAHLRHGDDKAPFPIAVAKGTTHCGSGCTLGDIVAELVFLAIPISVFGHAIFGAWIYDFVAAFAFGIAFQYFAIRPMRDVSRGEALKGSLKADALSLTAWQIGMYGWMAITTFVIFRHELRPTSIVFWFMMQIGMLAGFFTAYPVNWWLLRHGVKEAM